MSFNLNVIIDASGNMYVQIVNVDSLDDTFSANVNVPELTGFNLAKKAIENGITEVILNVKPKKAWISPKLNEFLEFVCKAGLKVVSEKGNEYCWSKKFTGNGRN